MGCRAALLAAVSNAEIQISDRILAHGIPGDARIDRASPVPAAAMSGGSRADVSHRVRYRLAVCFAT